LSKTRVRPKPQEPALLEDTQRLLAEAEALLGGPLVVYWNNKNGSITSDDAEAFRSLFLGRPPVETLHLSLTSTGGSGEASLRIAAALRQHCQRLVVHVPVRAESAATMLALAADEIRMAPCANLGPVDTTTRHALGPVGHNGDRVGVGMDELTRIVALWRQEQGKDGTATNPYQALYPHLHPLVIGAVDRAASLSLRICDSLLAYHEPNAARREAVANGLVSGFPSHGYPILLPEAQRIGIKAVPMDPALDRVLTALYRCHVHVGSTRRTDVDERRHHERSIPALLEAQGRVVFYGIDADWVLDGDGPKWRDINADNGWRIWDAGEPEPMPLAID
jgi:hypothetical protein